MKKSIYITAIAFLVLGGVLICFILFNRFRVEQLCSYYVNSHTERRELVIRLEDELSGLIEFDKKDVTHSALNDPDFYWPHDRLCLALAVQRFYNDNKRLPQSKQEVDVSLKQLDFKLIDHANYKYSLNSTGYIIHTSGGHLVGRGN